MDSPEPDVTPSEYETGSRAGIGIELKHLGKTYFPRNGEPTHVLRDVNIDIKPGEFVCIIGPSGCGKSTLLNILAGFEPATEGEVLADGKPLVKPSADRAVIFQDVSGALMPWLTALDNTALGLKFTGLNRSVREHRAREVLEAVGLSQSLGKYPHELSGGMQQRVQIARALAMRPRLLLMDEPFGALDYFTRASLQTMLVDVYTTHNLSVFFVTHDIDEAALLADTIWVMGHGTIDEIVRLESPRPRKVVEPEVTRVVSHLRQLLVH
jgi:NitT/TauT family transport system ATP-binding protein